MSLYEALVKDYTGRTLGRADRNAVVIIIEQRDRAKELIHDRMAGERGNRQRGNHPAVLVT
ncbi:hypothetical protein ABNT96_27205 [Klebsiella pneumoniae]